ncbi:MAG: 2-hydroxychromene-2-carboxylate isomerase [Alphaproteobacteria bacterium]|nr:2-hydroxychromene-2-carboxylate isomerase [Alphaproteobacteria bacterium]
MNKNPEFHFDFGSPNAYLVHKVIPEIELRTGAAFTYVPVLLGGIFKATNNKPPMVAFAEVKPKTAYIRLEIQRFVKKHGLDKFAFNPNFPVNTLQIMRGVVAAEMEGVFMPYVEAMFAGMWETGRKLDDPAVIAEILAAAGLDAQKLMARAQDPDVKAKLVANTEATVARGTFGIPTFFVGTEIFFGKDTLRDLEDEITHQQQAAAEQEPVREFP